MRSTAMKAVKRALILASLAGAATACTTATLAGPLTGLWGGQHIGLTLTPAGGRLDYDCAAGQIDGPVVLRRDGDFEASGTHTPSIGGPERVGEVRPSFPASYRGRVSGSKMMLSVEAQLPSGTTKMGPFALRRGVTPLLLRCL